MASLGTLILELATDTARFEGDLGRAAAIAESKMRNIKDTASRALGAVTVIATAAGAALTAALSSALDRADQLNKLSQAAGIAADQLSKLQFAAKQSGVDTEGLAVGLKKFNVEINNAASGNAAAQAAFKAVGVSVKDANGNVKDANTLLSQVAGGFAGAADGASKSALAVALFGKAGTDMIPLLNQGADGLKTLGDQAQRAGLVISQDAARAAEDFNDKLNVLKLTVTQGLGNALAGQLLPTLNNLADTFAHTADGASTLNDTAGTIANGLKVVGSAALIAGQYLNYYGKSIGAVAAQAVAIASGNFSQVAAIQKARNEDLEKDAKAFQDRMTAIWKDGDSDRLDFVDVHSKKSKKSLVFDPEAAAHEAAEHKKWLDKMIGEAIDAGNKQLDLKAANADLFENIDNEMYDNNIKVMNAALDSQEYRLKEFTKDSEFQYKQMSAFVDQAARNMQTALATFLFDPFKDGIKGMLSGFLDVVRRMIAEAAAAKLAGYLFGEQQSDGSRTSGVWSAALGGLFKGISGARAGGGSVNAGASYLVGENGPEVFTPGSSGGITPNNAMGGMTASVTYHIDARGATMELVKVLPEILRQHGEQTKADIISGLKNGRYGVQVH